MSDKRYVKITVSIEECTEHGKPVINDFLNVYLTKRLELSVADMTIFARQHQSREAVGEERDNGQFVGAANLIASNNGRQALMQAIWDYVRRRLGL